MLSWRIGCKDRRRGQRLRFVLAVMNLQIATREFVDYYFSLFA